MNRIVVIICLLVLAEVLYARVPAFPGAEGAGKYVVGGRGGKVLTVNSLKDDGTEGTFRWAVNQSGPRIIVFAVSGWINLERPLAIRCNDVTIAGQTAPGDGIGVRNYTLHVAADNVIIRYIRCRLGDCARSEDDAMNGTGHRDIIIDHCSMSWSIDECASFYGNRNFTMQWCIISESLRNSAHQKGRHGYGGIWGGERATFHHNLLAHHSSRNPRMCGSRYTGRPEDESVDVRNNVFYNWGPVNGAYAGEGGSYNLVNNYYKPGSSTAKAKRLAYRIFQPNFDDGKYVNKRGVWGRFYVAGNYFDDTCPGLQPAEREMIAAVNRDNWKGIHPRDTSEFWEGWTTIRAELEFAVGETEWTETAQNAYEAVLEHAGASLKRDAVDRRIIDEVRKGDYTYEGSRESRDGLIDSQQDVGGWPELESILALADSDGDGMPDEWERKHGLNPEQDDSALYSLGADYTNIEVYINELSRN